MLSTLLTPDYLNTHNTSAMFVSARQRALIIKGERKIREVVAQCNGDYSMDIIASTLYSFISILEELVGEPPDSMTFSFSTAVRVQDPFNESKQISRDLLINFDTTGAQYNRIGLDASNKLLHEYEIKLQEAWPILTKKWPGIL